ncbi:signal transduction histidine kinase [Agromyces hippuratus]|uniref:histidine kinase n=1 Tax=Agromyces hippuratus TaxID=286438 RepID=A0A852WXN3_9MICO|nr:sensor histidine kinase [Agromyces hippuratus]NYG22387.1 signal transduction histidine kinase [Agromyces hippuratus]
MTSPARVLWDAPAASPSPPGRVWRDWVLVAAIPPLVLLEAALRTDVPWRWLWAVVLIALVPTLLWRRTRPLLMLVIAFGTGAVVSVATGGDPQLAATAYMLVLVYAVFRWGDGRARIVGAALLVGSTTLSLAFGPTTLTDLVGGTAVLVATISLGAAFRWRAGSRARQLDRVKLDEREQLARDLHDTVAHHVSAIAIQAQAGTVLAATDPGAAIAALRTIEGEASRTLAEMRSIVRVLRRADAAELAPGPGLGDLRGLASADSADSTDSASASPRVEVRVTGDAESVPPTIGAAVYRMAQESVTNARRHARGATRVEVLVQVDDAGIRLDVHDDGVAAASASPGFGIVGMVERATLLGGTCAAGAAPEGGWTVTAALPRSGWAT